VTKFVVGYVTTNAPERAGDMQPQDENGDCYIWGSSPGLTGPIVEAEEAKMMIKPQEMSTLFGRVGMTLFTIYNATTEQYKVSGGDQWYADGFKDKVTGSISGTFEVNYQPLTYYFDIKNLNKQ
jgi:hypothetical protein